MGRKKGLRLVAGPGQVKLIPEKRMWHVIHGLLRNAGVKLRYAAVAVVAVAATAKLGPRIPRMPNLYARPYQMAMWLGRLCDCSLALACSTLYSDARRCSAQQTKRFRRHCYHHSATKQG